MTIAGSDSGGGAGIQADIKTIAACGCFAASAITAITAQNTVCVSGIHPVPVDMIEKQIRAVLDDIGADAVKIGMLHNSEIITTVSRTLASYDIRHIVLDPVMVATSGNILLEEAIETLKAELLPMATLITPNIPEARLLLGQSQWDDSCLSEYAQKLSRETGSAVLLKGGHAQRKEQEDVSEDVFYCARTNKHFVLTGKRIQTVNTHGTGCTLSSAIASFLARGFGLEEAMFSAKNYLNNALKSGAEYSIGTGHGPVHHFWNYQG